MNHSDDNQGRTKPVWFRNYQELKDAYVTGAICAMAVGAAVFLLWGVL